MLGSQTNIETTIMMKVTILLVAVVLQAATVSCAVIEPIEMKEAVELEQPLELIKYNEEILQVNKGVDEPVQVIESSEEIGFGTETSAIEEFSRLVQTRNSLLFRGVFRRSAVHNTIHVHRVTYRGRASTRISSVRAWQIGANLGATGRVVSGGVGNNFVTVELRSQRGRGFNIQVEVSGRL